ncbi:PREDICTED: protein tyrosine phosphatase receptor type C-associated protein [Chrysochloris asiatica]|uniref:Protein tyrosine phosphatase receptor type C-associated protein n=1 Tax=Chrysochloris asiatica TaxID=185453 RepID=A0A9B0WLJ9_CHRAS|nr:PREDICTED: protein tyrosine phosphatase receptor type C-associated protein [Chrysochloris asiatica]
MVSSEPPGFLGYGELEALLCALGLGTLMALPGALGSGGSNSGSENSKSATIVLLLLLLLLLLVTGLALAWHRLSRDSGGYYHPVRLGAALWGRTRRLVWSSPPGRWLRARAERVWLNNDNEPQEEEKDVEDDYVMDGSQGSAEPQDEEQQCEVGPSPEPEPADEVHDSDGKGGLGLSTQGPACAGGSAEALLSDLHAFAGSAAWDDSAAGAVGGQGPHVTAL